MATTFKIDTILVDAGILYALADGEDGWHDRAQDFISNFKGKLVVSSTVIPETCYLLNKYLGIQSETAFVKALADRELIIENCTQGDIARCLDVMDAYRDANVGFVDASLVAIAERLKIQKILTTDRRHFSMIRPKHCKRFILLPD